MRTEDTPDRRPEKPQTDHHFETPAVHEAPRQRRRARRHGRLGLGRVRDDYAAVGTGAL